MYVSIYIPLPSSVYLRQTHDYEWNFANKLPELLFNVIRNTMCVLFSHLWAGIARIFI